MDRRTIIAETSQERTDGGRRGRSTHQFQINETTQTIGGIKDQIIQNDIEYADEAKLLIEKDTHEQLCARIGSYDIETETRELKIQWGRVELLKHRKRPMGHYHHHLVRSNEERQEPY